MGQSILGLPVLGEPRVYVCTQCDYLFPNETFEDQAKIHRHLILHVPDSTRRWGLLDAWEEAQRGRQAFGRMLGHGR
jgi:hypothetical protein